VYFLKALIKRHLDSCIPCGRIQARPVDVERAIVKFITAKGCMVAPARWDKRGGRRERVEVERAHKESSFVLSIRGWGGAGQFLD
jgi:hypothetical protein